MLKRIIQLAVCVALSLTLILAGCGSSEEKAQTEYTRIVAIEKAGDLDQAAVLYAALAQKFPDTDAGRLADKARMRILTFKQTQQMLEMSKHVDRLRLALSGYQSMYGHFPKTLGELNSQNYYFDSQYLAESIPADTTIYLLLAGPDETRFWSVRQGMENGFVAGMKGNLQTMAPQEVEKEMADRYKVVEKVGSLVVVTMK